MTVKTMATKKIPILIADENAERRKICALSLSKAFALHYADTSEEALQLFKSKRPLIALVHADLKPASGVVLLKQIRQTPFGKKVKVLLWSNDFDESILGRETALTLGADDLTGLPLTKSKLTAKIMPMIGELTKALKKKPAKTNENEREASKPKATPAPKPEETTSKTESESADVASEREQAIDIVYRSVTPANEAEIAKSLGELSAKDEKQIGKKRLAKALGFYLRLDDANYYELLSVEPAANVGLIRKMYFKKAKLFHPDRFSLIENKRFKMIVGQVFKRMNEAYQVLSEPQKRKRYDRELVEGGNLRLIEKERTAEGPQAEALKIPDLKARRFYTLALNALTEGNLKVAKMNLKLALAIAKGNPIIKAKLSEVESQH